MSVFEFAYARNCLVMMKEKNILSLEKGGLPSPNDALKRCGAFPVGIWNKKENGY